MSGECIKTLTGHSGSVGSVGFSLKGEYLESGSRLLECGFSDFDKTNFILKLFCEDLSSLFNLLKTLDANYILLII